jgi:RNA polymerase sigma factor (sigma-70 family)
MTFRTTSSFQINDWLDIAGRIPLMTREECIHCARVIQSWRKGSGSERAGRRALNRMVQGNLRLVASIWKRQYLQKEIAFNHALELLQEGSHGLTEAALRFEPSKGCTFSTYATHWVIKSMKEYQRDSERLVRMKGDMHWKSIKAVKMLRETPQPSREQVEAELKIPFEKAKELARIYLLTEARSIDHSKSIEDDSGVGFHEMLPDPSSVKPEPEIPGACEILNNLFNHFEIDDRMRLLMVSRHEGSSSRRNRNGVNAAFTRAEHGKATHLFKQMRTGLCEQGISLASLTA